MPEKSITDIFKGNFVSSPSVIEQKLQSVKAYIFDWDGVFNNGHKYADGSSSFSETDSMGTNLIRFNHYLKHNELPAIAVITGEHNKAAFHLTTRENFNAVYYKMRHKESSLLHFCEANKIKAEEVLFVFDDVLDFSAAKIAGIRIMINHSCNPLLIEFAIKNKLVDYVTFLEGGQGAIREVSELILHLSNQFDKTIKHRMQFSNEYQTYINQRNQAPTFYTMKDNKIIQQNPS
jgi:3-deoxy-D-manno-octulosonate 8-phosphate phosphatase (KDO 8-P phosphatase)